MRRLIRAIWMRGFGPAAALLVLWAASLWAGVIWGGRTSSVRLCCGTIYWERFAAWFGPPPAPGSPLSMFDTLLWRDARGWRFLGPVPVAPRWRFELSRYEAEVSLFWPALALGVSPTLAWWRRSRRPPPGHCPACRYNRAGLDAAAPCPECGSAARSAGT